MLLIGDSFQVKYHFTAGNAQKQFNITLGPPPTCAWLLHRLISPCPLALLLTDSVTGQSEYLDLTKHVLHGQEVKKQK